MISRDISIFIIIQLAMVLHACSEAYMEGKDGWRWNPSWWRIRLPRGYTYTAYHFFVFIGMFPLLIIVLPLVIGGWDRHLFLVLVFSYIVGGRLEDFMWFAVNPLYPLSKWNPKETRWYPWMTIGKFSIPVAYVVHGIFAIILFLLILQEWKSLYFSS